ncbi:NAD(P)/FAD-dependent oxidoreductase [Methylomonas sp. SURF-1]|uniref:NAD(P)/FAD-dependent oxidoreductase n=1 Tax=Methylomonas aurea TaxID=2952224 RepID=A0ABT1UDF2_9GAMM|nr:NAD(P)/FAD-dependent oxidoreductase [Methylomonas sp. SURF-1]MCQ8180263.1 NAD(P)/FAD-dependent oxidoreductase [Methylomonas sp. SURF-1]
MRSVLSRRRFLTGCVGLGAGLLTGCSRWPLSDPAEPRVVVVGGGFAGATVAKYLKILDGGIRVTLVEAQSRYTTCPASNWLFAGMGDMERLSVDYQALRSRYGVEVVADTATALDLSRKRVQLQSGGAQAYDRLVLAPGIDFRWDVIAGYDAAAAERFPHAWKAGPQTLTLLRQVQAMPAGGVVLIAVPADPYRCPPGPYERASMMAFWLKQHKPRAKILILDAKRSFSKQALFEAGWAKHYGYGTPNSLIEWHSLADNPLLELHADSKILASEFGDRFTGDVLNIIPPQTAGSIARRSGLADAGGWCPVRPATAQSTFDEFVHVIGDAANYAPIPKSAFAANSEAKACAFAVVSLLREQPLAEAHWLNTCYSLVTPEHGISVAGVYKPDTGNTINSVSGAGGVSVGNNAEAERAEAEYAQIVYRNLVADSFA